MKENINYNESSKIEGIVLVISFFIILGILIMCIQLFSNEEKYNKNSNGENIDKVNKDIITSVPKKEEIVAYIPFYSEKDSNCVTSVSSSSKLLSVKVIDDIIKVKGTARYEEIDGKDYNFVNIRITLNSNVDINHLSIYFNGSEVNLKDVLIFEEGKYYFDYVDTIHGIEDKANIVIDYKDEIVYYYVDSSLVNSLKVVEEEDIKNSISVPTEEKDSIIDNQELTYDFTLLEVDNTNLDTEEKNYVLKLEGNVNYYEEGVMDSVSLGEYNNIVVVKLMAPENFTEDDLKKVVLEVSNPSDEATIYNEFEYDGIDADTNRYYKYIYNAVDTENVPYFSVDWDGEEDNYQKEIYTYDTSDVVLEEKNEDEQQSKIA